MRKSVLILTVFILAVVIVVGVYSLILNKTTYTLSLQEAEGILRIELIQDGNDVIITSVDKIEDIICAIFGVKRITKEASVSDYPSSVNDVITINIISRNEEKMTLYMYIKNNMYFIERPYDGIYQISEDEYNKINKYLKEEI